MIELTESASNSLSGLFDPTHRITKELSKISENLFELVALVKVFVLDKALWFMKVPCIR